MAISISSQLYINMVLVLDFFNVHGSLCEYMVVL